MKIAKNIIGILILGVFLVSCQKTEGLNWDDIYSTGGTISINIVGTSNDGIPLNESLIADKYSPVAAYESASYRNYGENINSFEFNRNMDVYGNEFIQFDFGSRDGIVSNVHLNLRYIKTLETGKLLNLQINNYNSYNPVLITNFVFDENTGNIAGKYLYQYSGYNNNTITVSGDFNLNVTQVSN